jgi:hypothetical protein
MPRAPLLNHRENYDLAKLYAEQAYYEQQLALTRQQIQSLLVRQWEARQAQKEKQDGSDAGTDSEIR